MRKKKVLKILMIILMITLVSPSMIKAQEYTISDTDIKITIDDSKWYVFTRDNLENNAQLKKLGISSSDLKRVLEEGSIYLDSLKILGNNEFTEQFVIKKQVPKVKNMSKYSDKELQEVAEEIAKKENTSDYKIYKTKYKYVYTKYKDSGKTIIDYYTVVNGYGYTIKTQKDTDFTSEEQQEIENIIKTVSFNVDSSLKEPSKGMNPIIKDAIIGAIVGGLGGGIISLVNKSKKKKTENS